MLPPKPVLPLFACLLGLDDLTPPSPIRQWWARVGPLAHAPLFLFFYFFAFLSVARPCLIRPWCEAATAFVYKAARDEGVAGPQTESVKELRRAAGKCAFFLRVCPLFLLSFLSSLLPSCPPSSSRLPSVHPGTPLIYSLGRPQGQNPWSGL